MLKKANQIREQLISWRHDFHEHPELGFKEYRTAEKIGDLLEGFGYHVRKEIAKTGIIADLGKSGPIFAIRADMDALPIQETNPAPYHSINNGVMHACGHDAHMAMALGSACLLSNEKFAGTIRFIFQPSEEDADEEGQSGAPRMVQAGAMDGVDMIIATHVEPTTPTGSIRIKSGPASGGVDSWFGEVIGKGGHGAHPHQTVDPFFIIAQIIVGLNGIVSRRLNPYDLAVVSIGSIRGGSIENVIPDRVEIKGTLRYVEDRVQTQIHEEIERVFKIANVYGGDFGLKFIEGSKPMQNTPQAAELIKSVAVDLIGEKNVLPWKEELGAEDFGSYTELAQGAMFTIGTNSGSSHYQLHNPDFDLDENSLAIGSAILSEAAIRFLRGKEF